MRNDHARRWRLWTQWCNRSRGLRCRWSCWWRRDGRRSYRCRSGRLRYGRRRRTSRTRSHRHRGRCRSRRGRLNNRRRWNRKRWPDRSLRKYDPRRGNHRRRRWRGRSFHSRNRRRCRRSRNRRPYWRRSYTHRSLLLANCIQNIARPGNIGEIDLGLNLVAIDSAGARLSCRSLRFAGGAQVCAHLLRFMFFHGTGVRLLLRDAYFRKCVENCFAFNFQLPGQIVDSNLAHPPFLSSGLSR